MTKNTFTELNTISNEINDWADRNFKVHLPKFGVLEEIGEITHCILKRAQGIRGFGDYLFFVEKLKDGIGDTVVYLLHDLRMSGENLIWDEEKFDLGGLPTDTDLENLKEILGKLAEASGALLQDQPYYGEFSPREAVLFYLDQLCVCYSFNLLEILEDTWGQVCKRNWKDNPIEGK